MQVWRTGDATGAIYELGSASALVAHIFVQRQDISAYGESSFSLALHFGMITGKGSGECEDKLCEQKPEDCIIRAGGNLQQPWIWFTFAA